MAARNYLADLPLDTTDVSAAWLNIESKARSNLFPWNGQFSPQFVEVMLSRYARDEALILDPFCGSGTVLAEASRLGLSATGIELNPAAYILARTYSLSNLPRDDRLKILNLVERKLQKLLLDDSPLFAALEASSTKSLKSSLIELLNEASPEERLVFESLIILADFFKGVDGPRLQKTWSRLRLTIKELPYSDEPIVLNHGDGRYPCETRRFDTVLTSPPYINVYNYHQQYRASAEALGWDLLHVARTEIGSNRKNRGNRFLTVTEYCLDLAICLDSLWRSTADDARIIFVMGRESMVRGLPFFNGQIAAGLAIDAVGYGLTLRQERVFTNRFGQHIYEDILHFSKPSPEKPHRNHLEQARLIAESALRSGLEKVGTDDVRADLLDALARVSEVTPSPRYSTPNTTSVSNYEPTDDLPNTSPRKTSRDSRERQAPGAR